MGLFAQKPETHPCDSCGREQEDCICDWAGGFPDDREGEEIDTEYFDFGYYEEYNRHEDGTEQDSA